MKVGDFFCSEVKLLRRQPDRWELVWHRQISVLRVPTNLWSHGSSFRKKKYKKIWIILNVVLPLMYQTFQLWERQCRRLKMVRWCKRLTVGAGQRPLQKYVGSTPTLTTNIIERRLLFEALQRWVETTDKRQLSLLWIH